MTQYSGFWNNGTGGDDTGTLWSSPYAAAERASWFNILEGSDAAAGYVLPGYLNNLKITQNSPAAMSVIVQSGGAFVRGFGYVSDASEVLTIAAAHATNPRLDRVVLQITFAIAEVRLAVVTGTAAATPALPALTQDATTYEVDIAHVWVPAASTTVLNREIDDRRLFRPNIQAMLLGVGAQNLIRNSEFFGLDDDDWPEYWEQGDTPSNLAGTRVARPAQQERGFAYQYDSGGNGLISQKFPVKASTMYAVKLLMKVDAGQVGRVLIASDSAAPGTIDHYVRRTGSWLEIYAYYLTEADATQITLTIGRQTGAPVTLGQTMVIEGYLPGPFRAFHERIMLNDAISDANWTATAKSTGTTVIDLDTDFGANVPQGVRNVLLYVEINDSGSAAGVCSLEIRTKNPSGGGAGSPLGMIYLQGVTNDVKRADQIAVGFDDRRVFQVLVTATGALTLDATIFIVGYDT